MAAYREALRRLVGRPGSLWSLVRSPALRFLVFGDPVDCALYALSIALPRVSFVQVGSNDGAAGDPLSAFVLRDHWHGIMVEPVPYVFRRLEEKHGQTSRLILENAAIADHCGSCDFHYIRESSDLPAGYDQLGSLDLSLVRRHASRVPGAIERLTTARVDCLSFGALCGKHAVESIDLIQIDAEGYDYEVLRQVDLSRYRPAIVLYEHVCLEERDRRAAWKLLRAHDYDIRTVGQNTLAVSQVAMVARPALKKAWCASVGGDGTSS